MSRAADNHVNLPVIEIGHLFPNYRPRTTSTSAAVAAREPSVEQNEAALSMNDGYIALLLEDASPTRKRRGGSSEGFASTERKKQREFYQEKWETMFEQLKAYKEDQGDCLVPRNYPPNPPLGQ